MWQLPIRPSNVSGYSRRRPKRCYAIGQREAADVARVEDDIAGGKKTFNAIVPMVVRIAYNAYLHDRSGWIRGEGRGGCRLDFWVGDVSALVRRGGLDANRGGYVIFFADDALEPLRYPERLPHGEIAWQHDVQRHLLVLDIVVPADAVRLKVERGEGSVHGVRNMLR